LTAFAFVTGIPNFLPILVKAGVDVVSDLAALGVLYEVGSESGSVLERRNGFEPVLGIIASPAAARFAFGRPSSLADDHLLLEVSLQSLGFQMDILP